jgi:hypothetical protein
MTASHPRKISFRPTFRKRRPGSARAIDAPSLSISPLIAVQFVMRDQFNDATAFASAWADFMAGYRERFRAGGLSAANTFAFSEFTRLSSEQDQLPSARSPDAHDGRPRAASPLRSRPPFSLPRRN